MCLQVIKPKGKICVSACVVQAKYNPREHFSSCPTHWVRSRCLRRRHDYRETAVSAYTQQNGNCWQQRFNPDSWFAFKSYFRKEILHTTYVSVSLCQTECVLAVPSWHQSIIMLCVFIVTWLFIQANLKYILSCGMWRREVLRKFTGVSDEESSSFLLHSLCFKPTKTYTAQFIMKLSFRNAQ